LAALIAALILAAGAASRYGSPKQLEQIGGESWVRRTARVALDAGCEPVRVVSGAHVDRVREDLRDFGGVETIHHPGWEAGMGSSIAAGIQTFYKDSRVRAVVLLTCDQLALDTTVVRNLCDAFDAVRLRTVASAYAGTIGIPALFERAWFERLVELCGDRGAKTLLLERPELRIDIGWPAGAQDIDRRRDPHG
jgi:molybdenum cofactor cytidylyltransferase